MRGFDPKTPPRPLQRGPWWRTPLIFIGIPTALIAIVLVASR